MEYDREKNLYFDKWVDIITDKPVRMMILKKESSIVFNSLRENLEQFTVSDNYPKYRISYISVYSEYNVLNGFDDIDLVVALAPLDQEQYTFLTLAVGNKVPVIYLCNPELKEELSIFNLTHFSPVHTTITTFFNELSDIDGNMECIYLKRHLLGSIERFYYLTSGFIVKSYKDFMNLLTPVTPTKSIYKDSRNILRESLIKELGFGLACTVVNRCEDFYAQPQNIEFLKRDMARCRWTNGVPDCSIDVDDNGELWHVDGASYSSVKLEKFNEELKNYLIGL